MSPDTPLYPKKYKVIEPIKLRIRKPDGSTVLMGYGIGDVIEVMEYEAILLIPGIIKRKEIPLSDGSFIVEYYDKFGRDILKEEVRHHASVR